MIRLPGREKGCNMDNIIVSTILDSIQVELIDEFTKKDGTNRNIYLRQAVAFYTNERLSEERLRKEQIAARKKRKAT